jgi:hypothetical protein
MNGSFRPTAVNRDWRQFGGTRPEAVSHRENLVCGLQSFNQEINQVE